MITLEFPLISKFKNPLYFVVTTSFFKAIHYVVIIEALSKCLFFAILIIQLESLITHSDALILLILESSKFNLNLPLIEGIH